MSTTEYSTMVDRPTFVSIDAEGAINLEWIYTDERLLFVWSPDEGAMAVKTSKDGQVSVEGSQATTTLLEWLKVAKDKT